MVATHQSDIDNLRKAGSILAEVLTETAKLVAPGVTAAELDLAAERMIKEKGVNLPFKLQTKWCCIPFPCGVVCIYKR